MKSILINSYDMSLGGVERSLINMLEHFKYDRYNVDLLLYRKEGELLNLVNSNVNILDENEKRKTFGTQLYKVIKDGEYGLATARILAKFIAMSTKKIKKLDEVGYYQDQLANYFSSRYLENIDREYDIAISYVWPHNLVANKVKAKKKIAWIHTDYSNIYLNKKKDLEVWYKFNHIIAVSKDCAYSFIKKYPELANKMVVIENIRSPKFIEHMSNEEVDDLDEKCDIKLVTVGRLCYPKGIDNAVKALSILRDKGIDNIKWYVIGFGPEEDNIRALIKENNLEDKFILLGKKINPYPYMKKCDIYVQPSRYEGKAVTVLEAQILGKPVLITNYPTAKSQLKDGVDGLITDLSVDGIVEGIEKLLFDNQLREKLIINTKSFDYSNSYELKKLYNVM